MKRMFLIPRRAAVSAATLGALALSACSTGTDSPTSPVRSVSLAGGSNTAPPPGSIRACKLAGPTGTYTFTVSVQGGGDHVIAAGGQASVYFNGGGVCADMYVQVPNASWANGVTANVTIAEIVPAGMEVTKIVIQHPFSSTIEDVTLTGTSSVTLTVNSTDIIKVGFYNGEAPPPPPVVANCYSFSGTAGVAMTPVQLEGSGGVGGPYTFSATGLPAGLTLSSSGLLSGTPTVTGTFTYTVTVTDADGNTATSGGCTVTIKPPETPGGEGCTPGYWKAKSHRDSWESTGYSTEQTVSSVFNVPAGLTLDGNSLGSYTLLQGLSFQGGTTTSGKAEILLRAAIAAVLNSGTVSYGMSAADIVAAVNSALSSGNDSTVLDLAAKLDGLNNQGCPLN